MPREDVPYPTSAICSIRERIAELRDELDQLLKTVNGVAGDANHEIKLISDNAALGITNDAAQHEIHLDLDASQLPAALVDSVNGQIGTVVLDGDDLDGVTPGNSVNDDIAALQGADTTLQGNINAEATARANADSTLQNNINAALATIPGEVASQITNNADIIQLQNDVLAIPNKVDKRTGAGKFAYTHDGSTQGDIALVDGTTGATIPIRNANGRMQAADPASGSTDNTLVTANWVSQTGDASPNNLLHRSGVETAANPKIGEMKKAERYSTVSATDVTDGLIWKEIYSSSQSYRHLQLKIRMSYGTNDFIADVDVIVQAANYYLNLAGSRSVNGNNANPPTGWLKACRDSNGVNHLFVCMNGTYRYSCIVELTDNYAPFQSTFRQSNFLLPDSSPVAEPQAADYVSIVTL